MTKQSKESILSQEKLRRKIALTRATLHSLEAFDTEVSSSVYRLAGEAIKDLRARKQVSQAWLANAIGCPQATLSQIENGRYNVGLHRYLDICKALEVGLQELHTLIKEKEQTS